MGEKRPNIRVRFLIFFLCVVCISVCEGMGVCLLVRGPASGRVRLCWDSQLLHGAVPGRTAGLVSVYWHPVCVSVCVSLHQCVWLDVGPLLSPSPHSHPLVFLCISLQFYKNGTEPCFCLIQQLCCWCCRVHFRSHIPTYKHLYQLQKLCSPWW